MKKLITAMMLVGCICLLYAACTMDGGSVSDKDKNKFFVCKDLRDGEVIKFKASTITNIRAGIGAPSTFDVVTLDGKKKSFSSSMEQYIKCEESR